MKEIIITSSVLILCIILIRAIFKGKISNRLLYALWLLAVLRLAVPVSVQIGPAGGAGEGFRVMDLVKRLEADFGDVEERLENPVHFTMAVNGSIGARLAGLMLGEEIPHASDGPTSVFLAGKVGASWLDIIRRIWRGGIVVVAVWMAVTNIVFWRRLRRERKEFALPEEMEAVFCHKTDKAAVRKRKRSMRIYVADRLSSPCLYGLPGREAIYLTPDIAEDMVRLRHVLTHELCHRRQGDSFWSVVRSVLVAVYWMNPLVWVAAVLSKRDCELACDEAAIKMLGEKERISYGETLLSIIVRKGRLSDIACTATTMTGSGRSIKERIGFIAGKQKALGVAVAATVGLAAAAVIFVFTKSPVFAGYAWKGEVTVTSENMQVTLPASIAGISGYDLEESGDSEEIVVYQTASGREAGRFLTISYGAAAELAETGREIVLLGDYGQNPNLRRYIEPAVGHTYHAYEETDYASGETAVPGTDSSTETTYIGEDSTVYLPAEEIITVQIPPQDAEGKCYIYLKGDYSGLPDQYREQMEYINGELAAAADRAIVVSINREIRKELFATLAENRTQYLGDASKSSALAGALPNPEGLAYKHVTLHTLQTEPETALSLAVNYELTADSWAETDNSDMMFFNAVMLFATIKNLERCDFVIENTGSVSYDREDVEEAMGVSLWLAESSADEEADYEAWLEKLYVRVSEYLK